MRMSFKVCSQLAMITYRKQRNKALANRLPIETKKINDLSPSGTSSYALNA